MFAPAALVLCFLGPAVGYDAALEQVESASKQANRSESPETLEALADAIEAIQAYPEELAVSGPGREQHILALINLARVYQNTGADAKAAVVMDEVIYWSGTSSPPVKKFGPRVVKLYEERLAKLEAGGKGTLEVECADSCTVYVDGNELAGTQTDLYLGVHQVHVNSMASDPLTTMVSITSAGHTLEYGGSSVPPPPPSPNVDAGTDTGEVDEPGSKIVWGMTRPPAKWKLAGLGASGGLLVGSAVLFGVSAHRIGPNGRFRQDLIAAAEESLLDDKPSNDVDPNGADLCAAAQTPPNPDLPSEVTNAEVTRICIGGDNWATIATGSAVVMAVSGASTLFFGLALGFHREDSATGRFIRDHHLGFGVAPRPEGGFSVAAGLRF